MTALTLHFLLTADAIWTWVLIAAVFGFVAFAFWLADVETKAQQREWRDLLHRTDQIRKGETK